MIKTFGIRHHGPGSARSLVKALQRTAPDCILVEAPQDAETAIGYIGHAGLDPPAALLIYNPANLKQASYYPFAAFSPEWQAILYANRRSVPVRLMDLPLTMQFTLEGEAGKDRQLAVALPQQEDEDEAGLAADPLGYMAGLAGYTDSERWWEDTFEAAEHDGGIFDAILELIAALRSELKRRESRMTLLREAHMRKIIRKAVKDGFRNIAVVCGAWHAPVLNDFAAFKQQTDDALLRGIKKTKVVATWIPWSYDRLAFQSGYPAGVISPAWYDLLFHQPEEQIVRWMAEVARLFRKEQMEASAAHVLEAVRLAGALAALRRKPIAGIDELQESAASIFCHGDETPMDLIRRELIIGRRVGKVPPEIPVVPLQRDLEQRISAARLTKYWGESGKIWLKATAAKERGEIDLRNEADLLKSLLLHRLNILDIPWGTQFETSQRDLGSFKEIWQLNWFPDFAIRIIEAGMWGNTVYDAAINYLQDKGSQTERLSEVADFLREALRADLGPAVDPLIRKLQQLAALERDVIYLMESLPGLVSIIQYGDTRKTDVRAVEKLINELIPRISIGLPGAAMNIEEEVAGELFRKILAVNHAVGLYDRQEHYESWFGALDRIAGNPTANELVQGGCVRILFDKGIFDVKTTGDRLHYALSSGNSALSIALWMEGFLHGSGLLLIYHPELWALLDDWVASLPMAVFEEALPLLRRTFADFTPAERRKMLELARRGGLSAEKHSAGGDLDPERTAMIEPTLKMLLGLN